MTSVRYGPAAAITHRHLDRAAVNSPGDLQAFSGQWIRMQDRVAEEFADDERGVPDGVLEDADRAEFLGTRPAREGNAGRGTRQVDDSRRAHLPGHPPWHRGAVPSALRISDARTGAGGNRSNLKGLITTGRRSQPARRSFRHTSKPARHCGSVTSS